MTNLLKQLSSIRLRPMVLALLIVASSLSMALFPTSSVGAAPKLENGYFSFSEGFSTIVINADGDKFRTNAHLVRVPTANPAQYRYSNNSVQVSVNANTTCRATITIDAENPSGPRLGSVPGVIYVTPGVEQTPPGAIIPCTQDFIDSTGSNGKSVIVLLSPSDAPPVNETPEQKEITLNVYSSVALRDQPATPRVTISNKGGSGVGDSRNLEWATQHNGRTSWTRDPGKYEICVAPITGVSGSTCTTANKTAFNPLRVYIGSSTDMPQEDGNTVTVNVLINLPPDRGSDSTTTYGPVEIAIDRNGENLGNGMTGSTTPEFLDYEQQTSLQTNIEISQTGSLRACVITLDLCANFTKETNTPVTVLIEVPSDRADDLIGAVENQSECQITPGIAWIVCPVVRFMAELVDGFYIYVSNMLEFSPRFFFDSASEDGYGAIRQPWQVMQTLANIFFGIAFLFVIYSQITSAGISNYGIKRMLPKLIVGAFLINASYFITAIAVDISNILGEGAYNLLRGTQLYGDVGTTTSVMGWDSLAVIVLAGGVLGSGMVSFAVFLPIVTAAFLAMITVTIVLTMRIALLVGLIILAPLAFAAYLLPNTEQWFKRWWATFRTMLLLYPVIALIFGGSVVANNVLNAVAGDAGGMTQITLQIMAAGVSVLPLFITPILMKTTSGILGQVTGMVNNKERGLLDRSKNIARDRQNRRKQMTMAGFGRFGARSSNNPINRVAKGWNNIRRNRQAELDKLDAIQEANWRGSASGTRANKRLDAAQQKLEKVKVDAEVENLEYNRQLRVDAALSSLNLESAKSGIQSEVSREAATKDTEAFAASQAKWAHEQATASSNAYGTTQFAENLKKDNERGEDLRKMAAGADPIGQGRAVAYATHTLNKRQQEVVGQVKETMSDYKHEQLQEVMEDSSKSVEERMAAAGMIASRNYREGKIKMLEYLGDEKNKATPGMKDIQMQAFQDSRGNLSEMMGTTELGDMERGDFSVANEARKRTDGSGGGVKVIPIRQHLMDKRLAAGKITTKKLPTLDPDDLKSMKELLDNNNMSALALEKTREFIAELRQPENATLYAEAKGEHREIFERILPSPPAE